MRHSVALLVAILLALPVSVASGAVSQPRPEVGILIRQGQQAQNAHNFDDALRLYHEALDTARALQDHQGEAITLYNIGAVYQLTGQPQQTLAFCNQALPILRAIGDTSGEANTLNNIGAVYFGLGQPQQALSFYNQALPLYDGVSDKGGAATTLSNIGSVFSGLGQPQQALSFFAQALPLFRAVGYTAGEASVLSNIGSIYLNIGQLQQALKLFTQALPLRHAIGDTGGEATTLNNIGLIYRDIGQSQRALDFYNQALSLSRAVGDKDGEAITLHNIGAIHESLGQSQQALEFYNQALSLSRALGDKRSEAITLNNIGLIYKNTNQPDKALEFYNNALALVRTGQDKAGEATTLSNISSLQAAQGHLQEATDSQKVALTILEDMRTELGGASANKESFLASNLFAYSFYINLLLKQNKTAEAFLWAEKTKARALLDLMENGQVAFTGSLTPQEQQYQQQLQQQASQLNNKLVAAALQGDANAVEGIKAQLAQNESDLQSFSDAVYARHPDLARQRAAKTVTLEDVARFLPPDTALLDYVTLATRELDKTVLFCVTNEGGQAAVKSYFIQRTQSQLSERIDDFITGCSDPKGEYEGKARDLFDLLLGPAATQLHGKKHLVVCPDGPLWGLPFQALLNDDDQPQFLLAQHEITYAYSATAAQAALQEKDDPRRLKPAHTLLAMANPDFGSAARFGNETAPVSSAANDPRAIVADSRAIVADSRAIIADSRGLLTQDGGIKSLPKTQDEVDALGKDFPDAMIDTGRDAQESIVKQQAGTFRYLHFATHGLFNDAAPMLSSIVLAQPPQGSAEDGFLTAREIADLKLSADLVVLSACETGRGEKRSGEGIVGLTWALFVAGAPSQVVSQWTVSDASTAMLMEKFYAHLKKGDAKGAALRAAELELMGDGQHAHPFYWAPFILVGDWR